MWKKWISNKDNEILFAETIERSKEGYYLYEPYFNYSDGSPSWQWRFMMAADNYKGRVALGGNRIGKSRQGAYECCLAVTGKHPARQFPESGLGWIIGLDNPMLRDVDRPLFEELLPSRFKKKFYKQDNIWILSGDGREWKVGLKSCEMGADKFQGAKVDWVWVDEEPKKTELFTEMEARLIDNKGVWWMTATPVRGTAWLHKLSKRTNVFTTFAGMRENPYLPREEIDDLEAHLTEDEIAVRIEGTYVIFGGRPVFDRKNLQAMMEYSKKVIDYKDGTLEEKVA